jgi:hypothetical protein
MVCMRSGSTQARDGIRTPAGSVGLPENPNTASTDHVVKRIRGAPAVSGRIGQRLDDLQLLNDRIILVPGNVTTHGGRSCGWAPTGQANR